jgi:hypothetical protein
VSEDEKYAIQGKAHSDFRAATSEVATLTTALRSFAKNLVDLGYAIEAFIADPARPDTSGLKPQSENLGDHLRKLDVGGAAWQLTEIHKEATRARLLKEQIDKF